MSRTNYIESICNYEGHIDECKAELALTRARPIKRRLILLAIGRSGLSDANRVLCKYLEEGKPDMACAAIALGASGDRKAAKSLVRLAQYGRHIRIRQSAAAALVYCTGVRSIAIVKAVLRIITDCTVDSVVRSSLVEAIGSWRRMGFVPQCAAIIDQTLVFAVSQADDIEVRATAAFVCGECRCRAARKVLKSVSAGDRRRVYGSHVNTIARQALRKLS